MIKNYIKTALRVLFKNRVFSLINIVGLAVSMSICLLIMLFIIDQKSYDDFHADADRLYRVYSDYKAPINSASQLYATTPITLGRILQDEYAGVENAVSIRRFGGMGVNGEIQASISGIYVNPAYLQVFGFELEQGNPETALTDPYSLILSREVAARYFGERLPVGQTLTIDEVAYTITGIIGDSPGPSNYAYDVLGSFSTLETESFQNLFADWQSTVRNTHTVILLDEKTSAREMQAQMATVIDQHYPGNEEAWLAGLYVEHIGDINLGKVMDNQLSVPLPAFIAYFLMVLGGVIMLAACFNYISLSIARSLTRAKEVGLRKVTGARRSHIVFQFLSESILVSLGALALAFTFLTWILPRFNSLWFIGFSETQIRLNVFQDINTYLVILAFSVAIGILAGLYPALYLSRFLPAKVLKGVLSKAGKTGLVLRKSLVVIQVAFSLIFIVSALVIYNQFQYMINADYGFEPTDIVNVELQDVDYDVFRENMSSYPGVAEVSAISNLPMTASRRDIWMRTEGMEQPEKGYRLSIDYNFIDNLGLSLVAGRGFSPEFAADEENSVVINETAVRQLNLGTSREAIGKNLTLFDDWHVQIVGVVKDFHTNEMVMGMDAIVLDYAPDQFEYANVRVQSGKLDTVLPQIEAAWTASGSIHSVEYQPYTVQIHQSPSMLIFEDFLGIVGFVSGIAVAIALLGLLGIAIFTVERRTKEVGIRKVLGAQSSRIILLLSRDFLMLIGIALIVALPLTWVVNNLWLQQFDFRVPLSAAEFIIGPMILLSLVVLTIGSQTLRAALKDPVDTLRYE